MIIRLDNALWIADRVEYIKTSVLRVRHRRLKKTDEYIRQLQQQMEERKFEPILVRLNHRKLELLNGNHRLLCAKAMRLICLPAFVFRRMTQGRLNEAIRNHRRPLG